MNQQEVRRFVERYLQAFSSHILEFHPGYLTVKLPVEVDKDIGNRPFYWSWVEKMNITPQPMILTFGFDPDRIPEGIRYEHIYFGSGRLQQMFQSANKNGRFVCLYEQPASPSATEAGSRLSAPLTPWLNVNLKVSLLCDKKRDILLYLGVNLHEPQLVHDFAASLQKLRLAPAIPDYFYTLDRRLSMEQAFRMVEQEVQRVIALQDDSWAAQARERLAAELEILEQYYSSLPDTADTAETKTDEPAAEEEHIRMQEGQPLSAGEDAARSGGPPPAEHASGAPSVSSDNVAPSGRILDFLRANGIPETPKQENPPSEWRNSTPAEERQRRIEELKWQYEPRIEVNLINAGLFYLRQASFPLTDDKTAGKM